MILDGLELLSCPRLVQYCHQLPCLDFYTHVSPKNLKFYVLPTYLAYIFLNFTFYLIHTTYIFHLIFYLIFMVIFIKIMSHYIAQLVVYDGVVVYMLICDTMGWMYYLKRICCNSKCLCIRISTKGLYKKTTDHVCLYFVEQCFPQFKIHCYMW
jgi:hypothetical protein